jgi:hypothetical protein
MEPGNPHMVNVWLYPYLPHEWYCQTFEGITGVGRTRDEALDVFKRDWAGRAPYRLIEGHPPRPRRDEPRPAAIEAEGDATRFHRAVIKAFHSDHHGHHTYTSDEIVGIVNRLWESTRGKP